jgi:mannose-6-phosphate isomerase
MSMKTFGGNIVNQHQMGKQGKQLLGSGPYEFFVYETFEDEEIYLDELRSFSVYVLLKPAKSVVTVRGVSEKLEEGDRVQSEDDAVHISVEGGAVRFLVSGTAHSSSRARGNSLTRYEDLYRVSKPWGHELWINGEHPCYAFKQILVKAGSKTSLQYHKFKQETNVLFQGAAKLHYKSNSSVANDQVRTMDLATLQIGPVSTVHVTPLTLHRLEAVTDILLYETSTPHLNDVVRVKDDTNRLGGRIESEHMD